MSKRLIVAALAVVVIGATVAVTGTAIAGTFTTTSPSAGLVTRQGPDLKLNGRSFQFAGTIYKQGTTEPDPGAVIIVTPDLPGALPIQMIADSVCNFRSPDDVYSGNSVPASAAATVCPSLTKGHALVKISLATTPGKGGDCNSCHVQGGTQPPIYIAPQL